MAAGAGSETGTDAERKTETIPEWKRREVDELTDLIESYDSVGVVSFAGIPSRQLQAMRRDLHGTARLRVSRNSLLERALEDAGEEKAELTENIEGQVGLIGTDENPFSLFQELERSKTPAPINAGETAPNPITIPEGDTGIDPGPFVGELQTVGASARIMDGSIQVTEDSTVLEAGEEVTRDLANVLSELGIEPKEVGLDLRAVYADGILFDPEDLDIDIGEYRTDVQAAAAAGRNLSINAAYPTERTAGALLSMGSSDALSLGLSAAIESPDIAEDLLSKANAQLRALAARIDDEEALPEELRGVEESDAAEGTEASTDESDASDDESDASDDEDTDADTTENDDDDDNDAGDSLGAMFG